MKDLPLTGGPKPHPIKTGTVTTVDMETGEVLSEKPNAMTLLPPAANVCQECAVDHPAFMPHDASSLYYQTRFYALHGRYPSWLDAMHHCADDTKEVVKATLRSLYERQGRPVPPELESPTEGGAR